MISKAELELSIIIHEILVTGVAGFLGSHVVRHFVKKHPSGEVFNLDSLTYAVNLENIRGVEACSNYHFLKMKHNLRERLPGLIKIIIKRNTNEDY